MLKLSRLMTALCGAMMLSSGPAIASEDELAQLKKQLEMLQQKVHKMEREQAREKAQAKADKKAQQAAPAKPSIKVGGAVRTNLSHTSYDDDNKNRGGDFDFDIFRLNFSGNVGGFGLNAEIRFFDYMTAVKYAYLHYDFAKDWQAQVGMTKVPFGNWPYNSHNYFFNTTYYIGLEDDHDMGVLFKRKVADNWQLDLGFFKNDELGGVDGYVEDRSDRYSYDIVGFRKAGDGVYDDPTQPLGEYNTFAGRYAYHFKHKGGTTEVGVSGLSGGLHDGTDNAGDYMAWAIHLNGNYGPWNLQLQHGEYEYDVDTPATRMAVGAYAFFDSIAAEATMSNANLAYSLPVEFGPITGLQFYNDYGIIYDKSDDSEDTWMNVTGVSLSAGAFFTYIDYVLAKNQPFVGGSIAGNSDETERRFNINIGYYF
ncbi:OprO/OprP family phosphate-selective porin [Pseudoalteromonas sp. DL2-H2.2]|uniref:OprO/OprP family phosphate-selective porin n=1 Tax=Pseudoalteromonas sp. DL2-H2.2 TaxID=2908889 RepID=UPI001F1A01D2|nr:OprO/OprP family phosphate-selective porin [Pseudoalteromonas sp. DL2-H2.2]MCF2910353.1 OprO/OprP family phosphate-selective porin [Pseudoalteromonas sp. DL2-H2.2]